MNKPLTATIDVFNKNNNNWMTVRDIYSKIDKSIFGYNKQGDSGKQAIIGARISENRELFEFDKSQHPQKIRLRQTSNVQKIDIVVPEQSNEESQKFSFNFEQDLKRHIIVNLEEIEKGLKLYSNGVEFSTDAGRIDILATDKENNFVVIELKAGVAGDKAIGQILGYMGWIKINLANDKNVRGIIISDSVDNRLKFAVSQINNLKVKQYQVRFSFHDITL